MKGVELQHITVTEGSGPTGGTFTIHGPCSGSITLSHDATANQVAQAVCDLEIASKLPPPLLLPLGGIVL